MNTTNSINAITKADILISLKNEDIKTFKEKLSGSIITCKDDEFDEARSIYNGMIDKEPALMVRCKDVADVIYSVNFARDHNLLTAIKGGGHNGPGLALCENGIVIDLSEMNGIHVDEDEQTATVEAGCTWNDVDHATHAFGLATVSGVISTTGVAGLTLGGGHGYLSREFGLTIDNLIEAQIVLANGELVTANSEKNPDLLWALKGGGGNFGVVTSFKYRLHEVKNIVGGPMFWPVEQTEKMMKWYRNWLPNAPDNIYAFFAVAEIPSAPPFPQEIHGRKVCGLMWCSTESESEVEPYLNKARKIAKPLFEHVGSMPYPAIQSMFDELYAPGLQWYWKGDFIKDIPDEAIEEHLKYAEVPTMLSTMHLYPINGKVHEVDETEAAWNNRDTNWSMVIAGVSADPDDKEKITQWARDYWKAIHPYSEGAAYINFLMEEGTDRIKATYGDNYERLQKVKATYDPENFFRVNQNIKPNK